MGDPAYRILVVDDDYETTEYLSTLLGSQGYAVEVAYTGEEALERLQAVHGQGGQPLPSLDLVLLDVMLPDLDGYEVCRLIKDDQELKHLPVIMLTALRSTSNKTRGLEIGADDYVTKPFQPEELLARVKAHLRMRQMEREVLQRNRELAALNAIAEAVSRSLDLEEVLTATLQRVLETMHMEAGIISLLDPEQEELVLRVQQGFPLEAAHQLVGLRLPLGQGVAGRVAQTGRAMVIANALADPLLAGLPATQGDRRPLVCVPLRAQSQVRGTMTVVGRPGQALTPQDLRLLEAIGNQVGMAIENARLYTELSEFTRELERSQAQLIQAEKLAATGRLAASIAHELNNPLQAIHNCLHLTLHMPLSEEKKQQYLSLAQEEVERLIDIVQRMLDFYRPSKGQRSPTDINALVESMLALAHKKIQHSNVRVTTDLAPDLPLIDAVGDQLKQVFLNIVINALEAMPEGGDLHITTALSEDGRWLKVSFTDTGVGLSPEELTHIFEPFYTTKAKGTGLGLSVSYGIVEKHGGRIEVESRVGHGSCFTVILPVPVDNNG